MRKRNKPILMGTLLVFFVAAAVGMNAMTAPKSHDHDQPQQQQDDTSKLGEKRSSDDTKTATADATQKMAGGDSKATPPPAKRPEAPGGPAGGPKMGIVRPKVDAAANKPKPNDSSTNAHWWRQEFGYKGDKK